MWYLECLARFDQFWTKDAERTCISPAHVQASLGRRGGMLIDVLGFVLVATQMFNTSLNATITVNSRTGGGGPSLLCHSPALARSALIAGHVAATTIKTGVIDFPALVLLFSGVIAYGLGHDTLGDDGRALQGRVDWECRSRHYFIIRAVPKRFYPHFRFRILVADPDAWPKHPAVKWTQR
jgi:hypothetical protein